MRNVRLSSPLPGLVCGQARTHRATTQMYVDDNECHHKLCLSLDVDSYMIIFLGHSVGCLGSRDVQRWQDILHGPRRFGSRLLAPHPRLYPPQNVSQEHVLRQLQYWCRRAIFMFPLRCVFSFHFSSSSYQISCPAC